MRDQRLPDRIASRIRVVTSGCWEWTGCTIGQNHGGGPYGKTRLAGKTLGAHRAVYSLLVGPIPSGLTLDHLCRNTLCVNPSHLEPVTLKVNLLRGISPFAKNARKTHCPKGHAYDEVNGRVYKGKRYCRACQCEKATQSRKANPERHREACRRYRQKMRLSNAR